MSYNSVDQTAYAASYSDPVRPINPYVPTELVSTGAATHLPIIGVVVVAGLILLMEHLRRKRGR